jgi:hypothetical protein
VVADEVRKTFRTYYKSYKRNCGYEKTNSKRYFRSGFFNSRRRKEVANGRDLLLNPEITTNIVAASNKLLI